MTDRPPEPRPLPEESPCDCTYTHVGHLSGCPGIAWDRAKEEESEALPAPSVLPETFTGKCRDCTDMEFCGSEFCRDPRHKRAPAPKPVEGKSFDTFKKELDDQLEGISEDQLVTEFEAMGVEFDPPAGQSESKTPVTDSACVDVDTYSGGYLISPNPKSGRWVESAIARKIETALAEKTAEVERLAAENLLFRGAQKACEDCDAPAMSELTTLREENERLREWHPIESAPRGVAKEGAPGYYWMYLAWGPKEDKHTGSGMRVGDKFYAAATYYRGGPFAGRQYEMRELEVTPTHWKPLPPAPVDAATEGVVS